MSDVSGDGAPIVTCLADGHVHLYPCYDIPVALCGLRDRLAGLAPDAMPVAFLAERYDGAFFEAMAKGRLALDSAGLRIESTAEPEAVRVTGATGRPLCLFAGRQIVTAERIEVLALTTDERIPDGRPVDETIERVRAAHGVPVLSWAPGKWMFGRARVIRGLIRSATPGTLLLGDSSLRPIGWGTPFLMRMGCRRGLAVLAGSDPLPFAGEETIMGSYATLIRGRFDPAAPVSSMRRILSNPTVSLRPAGRRCHPAAMWRRLRMNARVRSSGPACPP